MKRLILINGTMGVGKTALCQELKKRLPPCVFLDGDWCWDMEPFQVTQETKTLVMNNITDMLNRFLACPAFETVLFCWVLHQQAILDELLARLHLEGAELRIFTLTAKPDTLRAHIQKDVDTGLRAPDVLQRSLERLPLYEKMDTEKLAVETGCPAQLADEILRRLAK